ncbi:sensor histidine kinase [Archangium primigenium]|uniref:sensor histidine kinase n=1 Tax=[Archangium] primigenium TaxID=2792470 RepID=UPI0019593C8C|nr:ATP-binding protein [Archangium primigenium]MBM7113769.1 histidine kinase [Archangium primigenium]
MNPRPSPREALLRMQRRNYFVGASALLGGLVLHCVVTRDVPPGLVGVQLLSIVSFCLMGLGVGAGWISMRWAGALAAGLSLVTTTFFVHLSGGPQSPYFQVFFVMPFILSVFSPDSRMPTLIAGGAGLGVVILLNALAGVPPERILLQSVSFTTLLALALFGTRMYRRMIEAQQAAHAERLQALDQLAESERLRARAERERSDVERLVLVGQLAAGVAHEVNNPLAYVKANLSHVRRQLGSAHEPLDRQEMEEVLGETQQGVLRIQQIVTDLRGFSRAGVMGEEERGQLEQAAQEARRLVSMRLREEGAVHLVLAPGLPEVRLGQRHMVQVLVNLLLNAADAVDMAQPPRRPHITVSARLAAEGVILWVDDNGPGIPPEVLARLFEPFFTTKPPGKGTGLGLALCREYVARVGGSLHAENHAAGGARFVLSLPTAATLPLAQA